MERVTGKVTLTNLCLGQHLMPGMPKLQDQRGSPAYISPDVLSAQPYSGTVSSACPGHDVLTSILLKSFKSKYTFPLFSQHFTTS